MQPPGLTLLQPNSQPYLLLLPAAANDHGVATASLHDAADASNKVPMPFPLAPLPPHTNSSPTVSLLTIPCTALPSTPTPAVLLSKGNSARVAAATYGKLATPMKVVACFKDWDPNEQWNDGSQSFYNQPTT
jgi:hypothetical protein